MIRWFLLALIRAYQILISPMIGPSCRFIPSCSQYTHDAICLHGPLKGLFLGAARLAKCHPFHPGGFDPVVPCHPSKSAD
ncbi:MAG: membrane protein insertion efficiency factor YidD [Syntrophobacteraceae bacterium]|nr:membrane protein insertion efficiency factor YidD [Syntrophobacteraceae bacterium]NTV41824.1 membrane protein insertion efficiency factor YidD [Syntrophobacteraceae bacterium]